MIIGKQLRIFGFMVGNLRAKYTEEFYSTLEPLVASGDIKHKEDQTKGLENGGEAILSVQSGANKGKAIVVVATE